MADVILKSEYNAKIRKLDDTIQLITTCPCLAFALEGDLVQ